jgi:hypothetical protein
MTQRDWVDEGDRPDPRRTFREKFHPDILAAADAAEWSNVTLRNITIKKPGTHDVELSLAVAAGV